MSGTPKGRVTLQVIADEVGVSAKTVSNVVNESGWVSEPVAKRVREAIERLGYRPNLAARQLRTGRTGLVALVLPSLREPYFAEFAAAFVDAAKRRGLTVLVTQTGGGRVEEKRALEGTDLPNLDGVVISPLALLPEDLENRRSDFPLVLIGEFGEELLVQCTLGASQRVGHVGLDNVAAAKAATEELLRRGRRRIGVVGYQEDVTQATSRLRYAGYLEALAEAGITPDPQLVGQVEHFNRREGSEAVQEMLREGRNFDGLFCFSDSLAFGALYALAEAEISVPDQVEVMGFDNIAEGEYSARAFHTVDPGAERASVTILDLLEELRRGATPGLHQERVPFTVIEREHG